MKSGYFVIAVSVVIIALFFGLPRVLPSSIDYRGDKIKLSRFYFSYEDYKDDPNNIDPSENARVQRLVKEAPIARSIKSRKDAVDAVFAVKFPGYGSGGLGDDWQHNSITGFVVEIPRANASRYFIFRVNNGAYELIDDFVDSSLPGINHIEEKDGNLIYSVEGMGQTLVRPIRRS